MDVTDGDITNVRQISEQVFGDKEYIEIEEVKETGDDVMVRVRATSSGNLDTRNAFAGRNLRKYHDGGYVAVAVGGDEERHTAWFEQADAVEFGEPGPEGEFDLCDEWHATVGDHTVVLSVGGNTAAHVSRDGWTLDKHVMEKVLPSKVVIELEKIGFECGDVEREY